MTPTLHFAGGTDEIGASSLILDLGQERLIIDAGLRHKAREGSYTPAWTPLSERPPTAIVLTHAHLDHTGALPALHRRYPHLSIYATRATYKLISLMLEDSLKIMSLELKEGQEALFTREDLELALASVVPLDFDEPVYLGEGEDQISFSFEPAGHILGAGMLIARSQSGSICISGDICATPQLTIPAMSQRELNVDAIVIESTYGGRTHTSRAQEEERLLQQVSETLERGGSVLFPAFAIGRAQELILILVRAIEAGQLPFTPIYVDGLVRGVCSLYPLFPELLTPWLRHRVLSKGQPFWGGDSPVVPLWDPTQREQIARAKASKIIIASSGMLIGGPSALYARLLASQPKHLIAITGYQDEESPGRAVQNLAREGGGRLSLPDGEVQLRCQVATYGLSAHSDTPQLLSLVERSGAKQVVLVHGTGDARERLKEALLEHNPSLALFTPRLGERFELSAQAQTASQPLALPSAFSEDRLVTAEMLQQVAREALERKIKEMSPQEVAYELGWRGSQLTPHQLRQLIKSLEGEGSPFKKHKRRSNTYSIRVTPKGELVLRGHDGPLEPASLTPRLNPQVVGQLVQVAFQEAAVSPYKVKYPRSQRACELRFEFPDVARSVCEDALGWLNRELSGALIVSAEVHQEALARLVLSLLPAPWREALYRSPSLHVQERLVKLTLCLPALEGWALSEVQEELWERAGFKLALELRPDLTPGAVKLASDANSQAVPLNEERLKQLKPTLLFKPAEGVAQRKQFTVIQELRAACRAAGAKPKRLRPFSSHLELVFSKAQLTPKLKTALQAHAESSGWVIGVELKG